MTHCDWLNGSHERRIEMLPSSYFHILNVSCSPLHNHLHISKTKLDPADTRLAHATHYFTHTSPHFAACQRFTRESWMHFFRGLFLKINRLTFLHINSSEAAHIWYSETCCLFKMEQDLFLSQRVFGSLCKRLHLCYKHVIGVCFSTWMRVDFRLSFRRAADDGVM